ncbi:MAG TPA: hypothetical protein IGS53_16395 [Leptolyngbyaceae cyanobacterium M33_DOE_097]|uniref:Uncharacterized protein n=1 Tax=Oscillatoriales cyanobacterium SpSt-418 TaxID=2282169 RepID=A0A7C3PIS8_9CYAN|nr:hypothetical protein [Leptolyngbyaceae cyanobacterium M33_DOE_097]
MRSHRISRSLGFKFAIALTCNYPIESRDRTAEFTTLNHQLQNTQGVSSGFGHQLLGDRS